MCLALFTLRVVIKRSVVKHIMHLERGLHGQASGARYQVVSVQETQRVVEPLLAHVAEDFGLWREENARETIDVLFRYLYACVRYVYLLDE